MAPGNAPTPQLITQRPGNVVRRYGFELPARAESVGRARKLTAERLDRWGMDDDTCQTAILVVSELVTNAVVHAAGDHVVCEIREGEGHLRIAVEDQGYGPTGPQMHPHSDDEGGRGLFLIDSLCTGWGAHDTSGYGPGRVVWAELPHSASPPPHALPRTDVRAAPADLRPAELRSSELRPSDLRSAELRPAELSHSDQSRSDVPHGAVRRVRPAWPGRASEPMC